jgi:hypothetical protein
MNASFLDGTKCGEKGYCYAGMCSEMHSQANSNGKPFNHIDHLAVPISWTTIIMKAAVSIVAIAVGFL